VDNSSYWNPSILEVSSFDRILMTDIYLVTMYVYALLGHLVSALCTKQKKFITITIHQQSKSVMPE